MTPPADTASDSPGVPSACPHGNHVGFSRPDGELRQACTVCGGPRVVAQRDGIQLSGRETEPLRRAGRLRARRAVYRGGGLFAAVAGGFGLAITTLMTLLFGAGAWATLLPLVLSLPFVVLAFVALGKSGALSGQLRRALDAAWTAAARDVVGGWGKPLTASDLAVALGIEEAAAEGLLMDLAVENQVRSEVTDDGRLCFAPTLRIDTGLVAPDMLSADADLEARFEALAAEEERQAKRQVL